MKKININEILWFIILVLFSSYIYGLIKTNDIRNYIHPHMIKFVKFSFVVFLLLSILQLRKVFQPSNSNTLKLSILIYFIPLVLAFGVKPNELSMRIIDNKFVEFNTEVNIHNHEGYNDEDGEHFIHSYNDLRGDIEHITGQEIELSGFIYKKEGLQKDQFMISRTLMSCCAADTQIIGIVCETDSINNTTLKNNQWIKVKGTIDKRYLMKNGNIRAVPIIKIKEIRIIETPTNKYIYSKKPVIYNGFFSVLINFRLKINFFDNNIKRIK